MKNQMMNGNTDFMTIGLVAMGILLAIAIIIHIGKNRAMDNANEIFRNAAWDADQAIRRANELLENLRKVVYSRDAGKHLDEIKTRKAAYMSAHSDAMNAIARADEARREAYGEEHKAVRKQNLFLGGASDLSALSLYKRQDELQTIRINEKLVNPTIVLEKANQIINYQDMRNEIMRELAGSVGNENRKALPC